MATTRVDITQQCEIGVIGGSGFYSFLTEAETIDLETPYGRPSAPVTVGSVTGRRVAFIPRHGVDHQWPPHRVNYRANLWALAQVGVKQVLAPSAVGSLKPELGPGTFVVPDQVVDRTWGREHTFYDGEGPVGHASFADPYCPRGRAALVAAGAGETPPLVDGGTLVVINGPRFSSRAESQWHAAQGWSVVGMTGVPEASVARELGLCYSSISMVTDHDAGVDGGAAVTHQEVLKIFANNIDRMKVLLVRAIADLPAFDPESPCACQFAVEGLPPI